jgi:N-acetylated-alpha-linked acidic dipeptidase
VKSNWNMATLYDVIAKLPGSSESGEWVIRGNHHDAWVNGADDPISGQVAMLEEARALGDLVKQGWKPKRTIIYCAWDGEEPGLLGSTEWGETHAADLKQHAVVYINSDNNSRGYLNVSGSHSLEPFVNDVARSIVDPEKNISVLQRDQLRRSGAGGGGRGGRGDTAAPAGRGGGGGGQAFQIGALGSGSDYTVFLDFLGIASMDIRYGGEDNSAGVYHSIYDDFYWFTHFDDVSFLYGKALSQTIGTAVMRMADADLLPYDFNSLTGTVRRYETELEALAQTGRDQIIERNRQIDDKVFDATSDPQEKFVPPSRENVPPFLNFAPLRNAVEALARASERYGRAHSAAMRDGGALDSASLPDVNMRLLQCERMLTDDKGLPRRDWFKHMLYAPGFYTGYGVKTIPAVREAIEQKLWPEAEAQILRVSGVLEKEAAAIDAAAQSLEKAASH